MQSQHPHCGCVISQPVCKAALLNNVPFMTTVVRVSVSRIHRPYREFIFPPLTGLWDAASEVALGSRLSLGIVVSDLKEKNSVPKEKKVLFCSIIGQMNASWNRRDPFETDRRIVIE